MSKTSKRIIVAAVAVAAVSGPTFGAHAMSGHWFGGGMTLRHMDGNGDGKVTKREIMPRLTRRFDRLDANKNGKVTRDEIGEYVRKRVERRINRVFARFDADNDGVITKSELAARVEKHFSRLDADGNGEVSRAERRTFRDAMRAHMRKFFERDD